MSLRLLLVRHGLSSFNVERRIQGRDDLSVLTPEGQEQARRTGSALKDVSITAAYSSPLRRAASTCEGLLQAWGGVLDPVMDDGLLEIDLEPWSGMSADERAALEPCDRCCPSHPTRRPTRRRFRQARSTLRRSMIANRLSMTTSTANTCARTISRSLHLGERR